MKSSSIQDEFLGDPVKSEDLSVMQVGDTRSINVSGTRDEVGLFCIKVDVCNDSIISFTIREPGDFIYSDDHPGCLGYR